MSARDRDARSDDSPFAVDPRAIEVFCSRHGVKTLCLFGSAITDRFGPTSDVACVIFTR